MFLYPCQNSGYKMVGRIASKYIYGKLKALVGEAGSYNLTVYNIKRWYSTVANIQQLGNT